MNEISWKAPEFIHYPKSIWWFIVLLTVGLALVGLSLWQRDIMTAILFVLLIVLIVFFSLKKPRLLGIKLTGSAVQYGEMRVPMQQIKRFWIVYQPPMVKTVNFETTAYLNRVLTIQLMDTSPLNVRQLLLQYLPEQTDRPEDFGQRLARKLRF